MQVYLWIAGLIGLVLLVAFGPRDGGHHWGGGHRSDGWTPHDDYDDEDFLADQRAQDWSDRHH